jgi:hypothetical protein
LPDSAGFGWAESTARQETPSMTMNRTTAKRPKLETFMETLLWI